MSAPTTDSFMYQTMHRQPDDLRRILSDGWGPAAEAAEMLSRSKRVFVVGIGTSYHAALMGGWLLTAAGLDARSIHSYDFVHYPENHGVHADDAVIVMTHTGVKTFSAEAILRISDAGGTILSVGSMTSDHPGSNLVLRTTEREQSAAYTSSHLGAMTVLAQIATEVGARTNSSQTDAFRSALELLPEQVEDILAREDEVEPVARGAVDKRIYVTGAGPSEIAAIEAVIKGREAAYINIDGLGLEQYLHGPIVSFNEGDVAIVINVAGNSTNRTAEVAAVLDAMGGKLWIVGEQIDRLPNAPLFRVPATNELISPILTTVPMQLFAYYAAVAQGINPDTFRRDNPKYAEAFSLLTL